MAERSYSPLATDDGRLLEDEPAFHSRDSHSKRSQFSRSFWFPCVSVVAASLNYISPHSRHSSSHPHLASVRAVQCCCAIVVSVSTVAVVVYYLLHMWSLSEQAIHSPPLPPPTMLLTDSDEAEIEWKSAAHRVCVSASIPLSMCSEVAVRVLLEIGVSQKEYFHAVYSNDHVAARLRTQQQASSDTEHSAAVSSSTAHVVSVSDDPQSWKSLYDFHLPSNTTLPSPRLHSDSSHAGCGSSGALYIDYGRTGFGGQLGYWMGGLLAAIAYCRTFLIRGELGYARGCPFNNSRLSCFYIAPSPCWLDEPLYQALDTHSADNDAQAPEPYTWTAQHAQPAYPAAPLFLHFGMGEANLYWTDLIDDSYEQRVPPHWSHLDVPLWRSLLVLYLTRPQPWLRSWLQQQKEKLGWPLHIRDFEDSLRQSPASHPHLYSMRDESTMRRSDMVLAVHIRQGDKVAEDNSEVQGPEVYHRAALEYQARYGFRYVYVASDSPSVIDRVRREWTSFTVLSRSDLTAAGDDPTLEVGRHVFELPDATTYALDAIATLYLISICQAFISTVHSNLGTMGATLQYAKGFTRFPMHFIDKGGCDERGHRHVQIDKWMNISASMPEKE